MNQSLPRVFNIKDIELHTSSRRKISIARQHQLEFTIGVKSCMTEKSKEKKNRTVWEEEMLFGGDDRSVFVVKAYQIHRFGKNGVVASLTDTIGGIFSRLKDGIVFEEPLLNESSDGPDTPGIVLKFSIKAHPLVNTSIEEPHAIASEQIDAPTLAPAYLEDIDMASNPGINAATQVQTLKTTWGVLLQRLQLLNDIVANISQIRPYMSLALSVVAAANQVLIEPKGCDDKIVRLAGSMSMVLSFVDDAEPLALVKTRVKSITLILQQVTECGYFIVRYAKQKDSWIWANKYTVSDINARMASYERKFRELNIVFTEGMVAHSVAFTRMLNMVELTSESIVLDDIPYATGARYAREKGCLPGTREGLIRDICDILNDPNEGAPQVCLLMGVAGSGKSAVAHSIARLYDEQERLGSSFCFSKTDIVRRNPQNLFSTIARDLSDHDPQFKAALWETVKDNRSLRMSTSPFEQIEWLISQPSKNLDTIGPLVVVIDALDESGDPTSGPSP